MSVYYKPRGFTDGMWFDTKEEAIRAAQRQMGPNAETDILRVEIVAVVRSRTETEFVVANKPE